MVAVARIKFPPPTGSDHYLTMPEAAREISPCLAGTVLRDAIERLPVYGGTAKYQEDAHWRNPILFHGYFHGDNGARGRSPSSWIFSNVLTPKQC
jgi:hypothetical protein